MERTNPSAAVPTVAIIGGGFCGSVTAINLARLSAGPLEVVIINRDRELPVGVAYSTRRPEHLLNVSVDKMSALADQPRHFLDWLSARPEFRDISPAVLREEYVPRVYFGDYLREHFRETCGATAVRKGVHVRCIEGEAIDAHEANDQFEIHLAGGNSIAADAMVLATGNLPPAPLPGESAVIGHPGYFADAWSDWVERLPDPESDVVLVGTSLTGIDVFLTLEQLNWRGKILAVSRHGLLPLPYFPRVVYRVFDDDPSEFGFQRLVSVFRHHRRIMRKRG